MQKRTTTSQLNTAIKNKLLNLTKTEIFNKTTHQSDFISPDIFQESLDFLCESIFKDCIGWHYEYDIIEKQYIVECLRMDGSSDLIIIVHLCVCDDVDREDIDRMLIIMEED